MRTIEEIMAALDADDKKVFQSFSDKKVNDAITTYSAKNPTNKKLGERLRVIEETTDKKVKALQLEKYRDRKCLQAGIDPIIIENMGIIFSDEKDVDSKLDIYLKSFDEKKRQDLIKNIVNNSLRPGSGVAIEKQMTLEDFSNLPEKERIAMAANGEMAKLMLRNKK